MKKAVVYQSIITSGRVNPRVHKLIQTLLAGAEGKLVAISFKEVKRTRSLNQNAFYWGVVIPMVRGMFAEHGSDIADDALHVYLKREIGGMVETIHDPHGVVHQVVTTSTELTTNEWEDYLTKIRAWAAEFGLIIPFPNEGNH